MRSQARDGCESYLKTLEDPKVKNLQDIIDFNIRNAEKEFDEGMSISESFLQLHNRFLNSNPSIVYCPNQNGLIKAQKVSMSPKETKKNLEICRQWAAAQGVDKVIEETGVEVIVAPADSFFAGVGVASSKLQFLFSVESSRLTTFATGYPLASIPFTYVKSSGRPCGPHVIARANEEDKIIKFMSAWEKTLPPRRVPDLDLV